MKKRKLNMIDYIVIVVVIAIIGAVFYKVAIVNKTQSSGVKADAVETEYSMMVENVRMATVNAFHVGDNLYDDKTNSLMGEITNVEYVPYKETVVNNEGVFVSREKTDYFNVVIKVKSPVLEKEEGYFVSGVVELKRNAKIDVYTKYVSPKASVLDIGI